MKKIISLLLVIAMMAMMCAPVVFAANSTTAVADGGSGSGSKGNGGSGSVTIPFSPNTTKIKGTNASSVASTVLGVMQWVGIAIAVGMIIFAGIKYVMSGAGEKAKVKEQLVPILVGAILIGGATTVANIIFGLVSGE